MKHLKTALRGYFVPEKPAKPANALAPDASVVSPREAQTLEHLRAMVLCFDVEDSPDHNDYDVWLAARDYLRSVGVL